MVSSIAPRGSASLKSEDQLLRLFWNRAELKKEFSELRGEQARLKSELQRQGNLLLRSKQALEQLEGMLADPESAASAAVHFQLRSIWQHCRKRLARLANDLKMFQAESEHKMQLLDYEANTASELKAYRMRLSAAEKRRSAIEAELQELSRLGPARAWFERIFRKGRSRSKATLLESAGVAVQAEIVSLTSKVAEIESRAGPDFSELSVAGKRKINMALVAMAQELFLHFRKGDVAVKASDSVGRHFSSANYGEIDACRELSVLIARLLRKLEAMDDLPKRVQDRSRYIAQHADFLRDDDVMPSADSFDSIPLDIGSATRPASGHEQRMNVLGEDYWDINRFLLS